MNEELGPLQRVVEFLYAIGLPPMRILRMLLTISLIALVIAGIWILAFNESDNKSAKVTEPDLEETVVEEETQPDEDRTSYAFDLSVDQQIDEMLYFDPNEFGYVIIAGEFEKQKATIDELLLRDDITEKQKQKLQQIELRNSRALVERQMRSGIDATEALNSFQTLAQSLASGQDEAVKNLATYSIVKTAATELEYFTTEPNSRKLIEAFRNCQSAFINDQRRAEILLNQMLNTKRTNPEKPFVGDCVHELGKILANSSNSEIVKLGNQIGQFALFQHFNMTTLENRIRYKATDALPDLDKALRALEANPEVESNLWHLVMRSYEATLSTRDTDHFNTGRNIIGDLINKLSDSDLKKEDLVKRFARQLQRSEKRGTKFEVSGESIRQRKLEPSSNYTLVIFCNRNNSSNLIMGELMKGGNETGGSFRPIVCFEDPFTDEDMTRLNIIPSWIYIASEETAKQYVEHFAIDDFPYTFLIDKQNNVIEVNLSVVQARNRIAAMDRKEREALINSPTSPPTTSNSQ